MSALPQGRRRDRYYGLGYVTDALLHLPFEGGKPYETDFSVDTNGHLGQKATVSGGVIGRPGKFGKAVQIAEATTNLITNPSFETNMTGWSAGGTNTIERSTDQAKFGEYSLKCTYQDTIALAAYVITLTATAHAGSFWIYIPSSYTGTGLNARFTGFVGGINNDVLVNIDDSVVDQWQEVVLPILTPDAGDLTGILQVRDIGGVAGKYVYVDGFQIEAKGYTTPICIGNMGDGHSWSGTPHASTSVRAAAELSYDGSGNYDPNVGSVVAWVKRTEILSTNFNYLFRYDDGSDFNGVFTTNAGNGEIRCRHNGTAKSFGVYMSDERFIHIAWVWNENTAYLYIDGEYVDSVTGTTALSMNGTLYVGWNGLLIDTVLNGYIDDFAILDRALTADEVAQIYNVNAPFYYYPLLTNVVDNTRAQTIAGVKQFNDQMGVGGAPNANAILDLQSTSKPFMPPRMTTTQRDAVTSPTAGMVIFNTTTGVLNFYNGATWGAV